MPWWNSVLWNEVMVVSWGVPGGHPAVLQKHGGLWFNDEAFVVSRRRD
jgi:hypothetical protein